MRHRVAHLQDWEWLGYHEIMGQRRRYRLLDLDRLCWRLQTDSLAADSDEVGHLFRSMSDSVPIIPDSYRSEATLQVSDKWVSGWSQGFHV